MSTEAEIREMEERADRYRKTPPKNYQPPLRPRILRLCADVGALIDALREERGWREKLERELEEAEDYIADLEMEITERGEG